jgi:glycine cleavage system H lipoate-binding protein
MCPFLREGRARYCSAAPVRILIPDGPCATAGGRCTSADYRECGLVRHEACAEASCPHLEAIHVQYCGASPVAKLIPFNESKSSRCNSASHRFCETYLSLARPHRGCDPTAGLLFAPNHLWLDGDEDGLCHIGIDAFLASVVRAVDSVTFVTSNGTRRPTVALQVNGIEWPLTFPNPVLIQSVNTYLQRHPERVTADPYGAGWLFEGWEVPDRTHAGLISGDRAAAWLDEERQRLSHYVHDRHIACGDGGETVPGVARLLAKPDAVTLFHHFFGRSNWAAED